MNFVEKKLKGLLQEKIRSKTFKWNRFVEIGTEHPSRFHGVKYQDVYARENLKFLGKGSARHVYLLSSSHVLKIAAPTSKISYQRGIAQNEAEVEFSEKFRSNRLIAHVIRSDPQNKWIVSELVRPIKADEVPDLIGVSWDIFFKALAGDIDRKYLEPRIKRMKHTLEVDQHLTTYMKNDLENKIETYSGYQEELAKIPDWIWKDLDQLLQAGMSDGGDLYSIKHWGKTNDGRMVLLDYGLTEEIYFNMY